MIRTLMMSAATAALLAGAVSAGETAEETAAETDATAETAVPADGAQPASETVAETDTALNPTFDSIEDMTVGDVLDRTVLDPQGETIGDIDYVVMQPDGPAAVVGIGGFLGLGEYTVAMPLSEFEMYEDGSAFTLNTTKEALQERPEFDETGAESLPDETRIADLMSEEGETMGESAGAADEAAADENAAAEESSMSEAAEETAAEAEAAAESAAEAAEEGAEAMADTAEEAANEAEAAAESAAAEAEAMTEEATEGSETKAAE